MSLPKLYPMKLQAALHSKVWGGRKLAAQLGKRLPTDEPYGESWELHDSCVVMNGALRGQTLGELTRQYGEALLGAGQDGRQGFPLLAKFIDANDWLSVQAHPNDEQAQDLEGEPRGKTEAWHVLAADTGAKLVIGVKTGTTREQLKQAIRAGDLESHLQHAEVRAGDSLYLEAGAIHALGPGILIYEIQQASDRTYRLYDWGRMGLDGQPRELHIDKGLRVARLDSLPAVMRTEGELLVSCDYFQLWRHELAGGGRKIDGGGRFHALTCIAGEAQVEAAGCDSLHLHKGETGLVPASVGGFELAGSGVVLRAC